MAVQHFIDVDQLDLKQIEKIFAYATDYAQNPHSDSLRNQRLINIFFENSTRTRSSFEIAAKNMSAAVININVASSALKKGESEKDTLQTLAAMHPEFITIRHGEAGSVAKLCTHLADAIVINSGDGAHAHPTQALIDAFTIFTEKKFQTLDDFKKLKIAICGDIINSRVARSNIKLLGLLGAQLNLVGPITLLPQYTDFAAQKFIDLKSGLKEVDVIMALRIQRERMQSCFITSMSDFYKTYGITEQALTYANKDAIVLHPGPMNRNVEICEAIADDRSVCKALDQVKNGIAIRQAVLRFLSE